MFKKFKDKLAEEMKQSPARLQASVQQLAQVSVFYVFYVSFSIPFTISRLRVTGKETKKGEQFAIHFFFASSGSGVAGLVQQLDSGGAGVQ
jgi:hypothetical protein